MVSFLLTVLVVVAVAAVVAAAALVGFTRTSIMMNSVLVQA